MVTRVHHAATAGRQRVRRLFFSLALVAIAGTGMLADPMNAHRVEVTETGGVYRVTATFAVTESAQAVMAVLTDYDRIPTYVPDMDVSKVIERAPAGVVVEQQATSKFMMFSKRIHLVLEIREDAGFIHFRDRSGQSFESYEGSWIISQHDSLTVIDYRLSARPAFDVPGFVLKRLLKRDAAQLIDRIKVEIAARADRSK